MTLNCAVALILHFFSTEFDSFAGRLCHSGRRKLIRLSRTKLNRLIGNRRNQPYQTNTWSQTIRRVDRDNEDPKTKNQRETNRLRLTKSLFIYSDHVWGWSGVGWDGVGIRPTKVGNSSLLRGITGPKLREILKTTKIWVISGGGGRRSPDQSCRKF